MPKEIKIRVKELRMVPASQLVAHEQNFRKHPDRQRTAMDGILEEVGFAGAIVARELEDDRYEIIDGHLRADMTGDTEVPVVVTDLSEAEAKKVLATYDALGGMAEIDQNTLGNLLAEVDFINQSLGDLINGLAVDTSDVPIDDINEVSMDLKPVFKVVIECDDELQQLQLLERFGKEGLKCQALML